MVSPQRKKFSSSQDWNNFIGSQQPMTGQQLLELRKACYKEIEEYRGRPLLIYATRFLD